MKILHVLKASADEKVSLIITIHAKDVNNEVKVVDLSSPDISYEELVADIFSFDRVFSW
ncbi:MAG: hypothetical protein K8I29_11040 [Alphaproteobacteria bacterium]|uniref:Uncharacterized protein n=1 Tax=Candidatus Nitrobium versatile TaxID=2884831 RepID=A0A953JFE0_9BACT|nr:hypothetical protein [Candidatus Nitrobium versatile]